MESNPESDRCVEIINPLVIYMIKRVSLGLNISDLTERRKDETCL